ncbi:hypothetical protein SUS17_1218 [Sphingomonas sp. S17]|nr:hypothetical protein SUS17_1218 [Sphingomonas sp. S17]
MKSAHRSTPLRVSRCDLVMLPTSASRILRGINKTDNKESNRLECFVFQS